MYNPLGSPRDREALPKTNGQNAQGAMASRTPWLTRRYTKLLAAVLVLLVGVPLVFRFHGTTHWRPLAAPHAPEPEAERVHETPPLYGRFHEYEMQTSRQTADPPDTKYIFFANHAHTCGWGNVMQELLLHSYLAHRLGRTFVYYNYTWGRDGPDIASYNGIPIPSRIPLTALLQGPVTGAPSITDPYAPRPMAISEDYYAEICPPEKRRLIDSGPIDKSLGVSTVATIAEKWIEIFSTIDDKCVEVPRDAYPVFDIFIFGSAERLLDAWPSLSRSPTLQEFGWSPLIELAFDTNRELIAPSHIFEPALLSTPLRVPAPAAYSFDVDSASSVHTAQVTPSGARYTPVPGLLAMHIRRGDFAEHCVNLGKWGAAYSGFNSFPALPDKFPVPSHLPEDERVEAFRPHCYPDIDEIVRRAEEVALEEEVKGRQRLRDVYIMTNGPAEWVAELKERLVQKGNGRWRMVTSSRDLMLNWEQRYVKQAVDMLIGQRAQVFVGNAFSSLTGIINMARMASGVPPEQSRLL
ncbi:uncharacterized protein LAESUDRAFT_724558 [Laetiporus sulphureus 93-53]|uniref:Uncharacterized protein n=1 Tax=Laetiporus sulphureus 93-53 TaxID=1314785 RepID=A0A165ER94_9APHY|nr:uncharacterized protein LAESUDRAFT_724558 [Laetiporus sulphureus 93-53]KZT07597.1 hypothetical protein LAESUDRAFT_724558 [Laetiporus sulphureus 93-53]